MCVYSYSTSLKIQASIHVHVHKLYSRQSIDACYKGVTFFFFFFFNVIENNVNPAKEHEEKKNPVPTVALDRVCVLV